MTSATGKSLTYLTLLQGMNLLLPIVTLPWLLRVLEPRAFGSYSLGIALVSYALILVEFGFQLTATKRVAQVRDDQAVLSEYFWTVQTARTLLAGVSIVIGAVVVACVPAFRDIHAVIIANLPMIIGIVLFPQWFYLGLEQIRTASLINIGARGLCVLPVFLFVRSPEDVVIAAIINASSGVIAGAASSYYIFSRGLIGKFLRPSRLEIIKVCREAFPIFITACAFSFYSTSNTVILGILRDSYQVGIFNAADKIRTALFLPINVFSSVFYPRVSRLMVEDRTKALRTILLLAVFLGSLMGILALALFFLAPRIIQLVVGSSFPESVPVLQILSPILLLVGISTALGTIGMLNLEMKKSYTLIVVTSGLLNLPLLVVLASRYGAEGAAMSLTITETVATLLVIAVLIRTGYLKAAFSKR